MVVFHSISVSLGLAHLYAIDYVLFVFFLYEIVLSSWNLPWQPIYT